MTNAELLTAVKNGLGITGDYQDETLKLYIDEAKAFMLGAGVSESVVESDAAVGCIIRGVADLWTYGSGDGKLSQYFMQRAIQLSFQKKE